MSTWTSSDNAFAMVSTKDNGSIPILVRVDRIEAIKDKSVVMVGGNEYAIDDQRDFIARTVKAMGMKP